MISRSYPVRSTTRQYFSTPVALRIHKPNRGSAGTGWVICAKVTDFFDGRPVLGVAWKTQHGTSEAISLPVCVLNYAIQAGATEFYLQDQRSRQMWTCALDTFRRSRLGPDGEHYMPLAWLNECQFREWRYAAQHVDLTPMPAAAEAITQQQLPLW